MNIGHSWCLSHPPYAPRHAVLLRFSAPKSLYNAHERGVEALRVHRLDIACRGENAKNLSPSMLVTFSFFTCLFTFTDVSGNTCAGRQPGEATGRIVLRPSSRRLKPPKSDPQSEKASVNHIKDSLHVFCFWVSFWISCMVLLGSSMSEKHLDFPSIRPQKRQNAPPNAISGPPGPPPTEPACRVGPKSRSKCVEISRRSSRRGTQPVRSRTGPSYIGPGGGPDVPQITDEF